MMRFGTPLCVTTHVITKYREGVKCLPFQTEELTHFTLLSTASRSTVSMNAVNLSYPGSVHKLTYQTLSLEHYQDEAVHTSTGNRSDVKSCPSSLNTDLLMEKYDAETGVIIVLNHSRSQEVEKV